MAGLSVAHRLDKVRVRELRLGLLPGFRVRVNDSYRCAIPPVPIWPLMFMETSSGINSPSSSVVLAYV